MTHQHLAGHESDPELTLGNVDFSFWTWNAYNVVEQM